MNENPVFIDDKYQLRRFLRELNLDSPVDLEKRSEEIIGHIRRVAGVNDSFLGGCHKEEYEKAIRQLEEASSRGDFNGGFSDTLEHLIYVLYGLNK